MLIDSHSHLNFQAYDSDLAEVIKRCQEKNMTVVNVGSQYATSQRAVDMALAYPNFYAVIGLHPIHAFDEPFTLKAYTSLYNDKVVAIGETGFDYWHFKYLNEPYTIILLHGWGGHKDDRFFKWLDGELTKLGHRVIRFTFPETDNPKQDLWVKEVQKQVGYVNGKTIFMGFSLGGTTIFRFLETLDEDAKIAGVYLLGVPTNPLGYPELEDFFKKDFDWAKIKSVCPKFFIYNSTNDEIVNAEHGQKLAKELNAPIRIIDNAWHFLLETFPELVKDMEGLIKEERKKLPDINQVISVQRELFLKHIALAKQLNLPLMLHGRNGLEGRDVYVDMLEILQNEKITKAVFHCFGGSLTMAKKIVEAGFYIGIDGPVTFKNKSEDLQAMVKEIPLTSILIETDAPYLTPEPHRGERNEPVYVEFIAQKTAELKNLTKEEVIEQTWQNAKKLFNI